MSAAHEGAFVLVSFACLAALVVESCAVSGCSPAVDHRGPAVVPLRASFDARGYPWDDPEGARVGEACAVAGRVLWRAACREAEPTLVDTGGGVKTLVAFPEFCRSRRDLLDAACIATVGADRARLREQCRVRCLVREADAGAAP